LVLIWPESIATLHFRGLPRGRRSLLPRVTSPPWPCGRCSLSG